MFCWNKAIYEPLLAHLPKPGDSQTNRTCFNLKRWKTSLNIPRYHFQASFVESRESHILLVLKGYSFICPGLIYILSQPAATAILCWSVWRARGGGRRAVEGVIEKVCVLLTWHRNWAQQPLCCPRVCQCNYHLDVALSRYCFFPGHRVKEETCGQVSVGSRERI